MQILRFLQSHCKYYYSCKPASPSSLPPSRPYCIPYSSSSYYYYSSSYSYYYFYYY